MRSLRLPKLNKPLIVRRTAGTSMLPQFLPGQIVWGSSIFWILKPGNIVIFRHAGLEKIKRIIKVDGQQLFLQGDNLDASTDSRHYGWINQNQVVAKSFQFKL